MTGYVLHYAVFADGKEPVDIEATSHQEAVESFVSNPRIRWGFRQGNYEPKDGEVISVYGVSQDDYQEWRYADMRYSALRSKALSNKKGAKAAREKLERMQALVPPQSTLQKFKVKHEVVHIVSEVKS